MVNLNYNWYNKALLIILLIATVSCSKQKQVDFYEIEDKVYDIPLKSQVSIRVELKDSTISKRQVVDLIKILSESQMSRKMKYHRKPTHVFVYIYRSKADWFKNTGSWIAMFEKIGEDDPGNYQYHDERLN